MFSSLWFSSEGCHARAVGLGNRGPASVVPSLVEDGLKMVDKIVEREEAAAAENLSTRHSLDVYHALNRIP